MPPDTEGLWEALTPLVPPLDETLVYHRTSPPPLTVTDMRDLFVIHAVLLHTGKVLMFSGHAEALYYAPVSYLFTPSSGSLDRKAWPTDFDLFCCHYAQLDDGKILVVGGSQRDDLSGTYHGSSGGNYIALFDPALGVESWVPVPGSRRLTEGRWYPTAVHLGDGRVLVFSGRREDASGVLPETPPQGGPPPPAAISRLVEALAPPDFTPRPVDTGPPATRPMLPLYPGLHLTPDGRILYSHTNWGQEVREPPTMALSVGGPRTAPTGTWSTFGGAATAQPTRPRREEGMSVLLPLVPPAYEARILVVGGSQAQDSAGDPVAANGTRIFHHVVAGDSTSTEIMSVPRNAAPTWAAGPTLKRPRINGHCVLLPDGRVLILGGHDAYKWNARLNHPGDTTTPRTQPSLEVELWRPGEATTTLGAPMDANSSRMYHSIALLLPNGKVLVAGGADPNWNEPSLNNTDTHTYPGGWPSDRRYDPGPPGAVRRNGDVPEPLNRKDYQIYQPPYMHNGTQPVIDSVTPSGQVNYGQTLVIRSAQASSITGGRVVLMRPGAVTHHTDSEQRYVALPFTVSGNDITATVPAASEASLLPPGYYMLWIVTSGTPPLPCGEAKWIKVAHPPPAPPPPPSSGGWCPFSVIAVGTTLAPALTYLRDLRAEISDGSRAGSRFVGFVNRSYYAVGRRVAPRLARHPRLRRAARDVFMRPAVGAIRAAERAARRVRPAPVSRAVLMGLLALEAGAALALAPVWLPWLGLLALRSEGEATSAC